MPTRYTAVVKRNVRGDIMLVLAVFKDYDDAAKWAENADEWYGPDHPLTPLTLASDVLFEPKLFPVEAGRK